MAYELQLNAGVTGTDQLASLESTIQQIAKAAGISEGSLRMFQSILKAGADEGRNLDTTLKELAKSESQAGLEVGRLAGLLRTQIQATKELGTAEGQRSTQQQRAFEQEEAAWRRIQGAHEQALKMNAQHDQANQQLAASIRNFIQNPLQAAGQAAEGFVLQYGAIGVAAVGVGAGLAMVGGWLVKNASDTAQYAEAIHNLALRTGLSTTEAQLFSRASEVVGVNAGSLTTAMRTLSRGMSENSDEGKLQKRVLVDLMGASGAAAAAFKPMGELLPEIFRKLSEVGLVAERDRMIITLFGRSGLELAPLVGHLDELEKRVKATGVVMGEEGTDKAKNYAEQLHLLGMQWDALKLTLGQKAIGIISIVAVPAGIAGKAMGAASAVEEALRAAVLQGALGGKPSTTDVEMHETAGYGYGTSMSRATHGAEGRTSARNQAALDAVLDANQDPKKRIQEQIKEQEAKLVSAENKVRGAKLGDEAGRAAALEEVRTILAKTNALREQEKAIGQKGAAADAWDHKAAEAEARELSGQDKIKAAYAENLRLIAEQARQKEFHSKAEVSRAEADAKRIRDAQQAVYDQQLKQAQITAQREEQSTIYKANRRQADLEAAGTSRRMLAAGKIHEPEQAGTTADPGEIPQIQPTGESTPPPTASPTTPLPAIEPPPQKTGIDDNTLKLIDNTLATQANTLATQDMAGQPRQSDAATVLNSLPRFAQGGVTSGPSIAGEAGPELIIPLKGASSYLQAGDTSFSGAMSGAQLPGVLGKLKELIDRQSAGQIATTGGSPMQLSDLVQIPTSKAELALSAAAMLPLGKLGGALGKAAGRAGKGIRAAESAAAEIAGVEAAAKEPWQIPQERLVKYRDTLPKRNAPFDAAGGYSEEEMNARTLRNRAVETEAPSVQHHPVGSWGLDSTGELMQLREYKLDDTRLIFPEGMPHPGNQTVQKYADWIRAGSKPPALTALETEKGSIKIQEGHHRAAAIRETGGDSVQAWTSITKNRPLGNGQVMPEGVTHEKAVRTALAEGKPVPTEVLAAYPDLKPSYDVAASPGSRTWSALKDESGAFRPGNLINSGAWIFPDGTTTPVGRFVSHAAEARLAGQSETELLKQGAIRVRGNNVEAWAPQYLETSAGQRAREMASGRGEFPVTTSYRNDTAQQAMRRTGFLGDAWASLRDETGSFTPGNLTGRAPPAAERGQPNQGPDNLQSFTGEPGPFTPGNVTDSVTSGQASVRALRAQMAYRGGGAAAQATADSWEARLSRSLGIPQAPFIPREGGLPPIHPPFDLQNDKIGVEVKTVQETAGDQIFQKAPARARKDAAVAAHNIQPFTIAVDTRASKPVYYVKEGYKNFHLGSMNRFDRVSDLKAYLPAYAEGGMVAQTGLAEVHAGEAVVPQADTLKRSVDQLTAQIAAQGQEFRNSARRGKGLAATSAYEGDPEYRAERKEFQQAEAETGARRVSLQSDLDQDEIRKQKANYEQSKNNGEDPKKLLTDKTRIDNLIIAADEKQKAALYQAADEYSQKLLALDKKYADEKQKDIKAEFDNQRRLDDVRTQGTERRLRDTSQRQVRNIEAAAMPGHEGETAFQIEQKQIQAAGLERAFDLAHFEREQQAAEKEYADSAKESADKRQRSERLAKIEQDNIKSQDDLYKQIDDARYERQRKILDLQKQEQERMVNAGVGLIMAAQQGGGKGATDFIKGELQGLERTVLHNVLTMAAQSKTGQQVQKGLHLPGVLGDIFAGTPFGKDPAKAGQDQTNVLLTGEQRLSTTRNDLLTQILAQLKQGAKSPSSGGGSAGGGSSILAGLSGLLGLGSGSGGGESIGAGDSTAGLTQLPSGLWQRGPAGSAVPGGDNSPWSATSGGYSGAGYGGGDNSPWSATNIPGDNSGSGEGATATNPGAETSGLPTDGQQSGGNSGEGAGGMTLGKGIGIGMAAAGAFQGVMQASKGGAHNITAGIGETALAIAPMTGPAAPFVAAAGAALEIVSMFLGKGPQQKEAEIQKHLQTHQFVAPQALNVSMDSATGGYSDYDYRGQARGSNLSPYPQVQQSYADYRHGVVVPGRVTSPFGPTLAPTVQQPYPQTSPSGPGAGGNTYIFAPAVSTIDTTGVRQFLTTHGPAIAEAVGRDFAGNQSVLNAMRKANVV